jgi:hypothetical protein
MRKALITLNKSYEKELMCVDDFYSDLRKELQQTIMKMEKKLTPQGVTTTPFSKNFPSFCWRHGHNLVC